MWSLFLHRRHTIRLYAAEYTWRLKHPTRSLIFVIYDTPKVAIFGALTCYVYSDPSLYRQVGVAFLLRLNIWIQSGSTMWLCDELLTIVVLALVNRFVHGRVPTTVNEILLTVWLGHKGIKSYNQIPPPSPPVSSLPSLSLSPPPLSSSSLLWERSGSVIECLTRDQGAAGSSLTGVTALCPWARTLILA